MHEFTLAEVDSDCVLCEIENKEKKRLRVDDEGELCEMMVNKERKRSRVDEEVGFLTANEDTGVSSSSSCSEMVSELADDLPLSPSVGHSIEQISIQGELQAVENGTLSCGHLFHTLAASTKDAEEETMSSLQSSINSPVASSSSSFIPVALASNLDVDGCQLAEIENSGASGFLDLPQDDFWLDDQFAFLTSCGASESDSLPMSDCDDNLCNLLDFDTSGELGMTGLWQ